MSVIRVENLNKSIKGKVILEDLSFTVERGDCLALIGPNGAGKTTLMDCLDRKSTRLNSSHRSLSRMPSSA